MTERRRFIATASGVMVAAAAGAIVDAPNVIAQPKVQWRMSTAYTAVFDIHHGVAQALVGPWDHVAEGAYHQLVAV
jgi:TRAP-type mannitol/chloroaromatic compound transport system substrate-binding protein